MTTHYDGDCCPACSSYRVLPYAVILGAREEYGYMCEACQITWRVQAYDATRAAAEHGRSPAA